MKTCFKCGVCAPLSEFYKHSKMADGYLNKCKSCAKRDVQKNYRENIEHYTEYEKQRAQDPERVRAKKAYSQTEGGKAAHRLATQKYRADNPTRYAAHCALNNAVRDGVLTPWPTCAVPTCTNTKVEGHHPDYNAPLDVVWLCTKHHSQIHKDLND